MLRGILNRAMAGRRRSAGTPMGTRRPTPRAGRPAAGNRDIERGARSIMRGLRRRRTGL